VVRYADRIFRPAGYLPEHRIVRRFLSLLTTRLFSAGVVLPPKCRPTVDFGETFTVVIMAPDAVLPRDALPSWRAAAPRAHRSSPVRSEGLIEQGRKMYGIYLTR